MWTGRSISVRLRPSWKPGRWAGWGPRDPGHSGSPPPPAAGPHRRCWRRETRPPAPAWPHPSPGPAGARTASAARRWGLAPLSHHPGHGQKSIACISLSVRIRTRPGISRARESPCRRGGMARQDSPQHPHRLPGHQLGSPPHPYGVKCSSFAFHMFKISFAVPVIPSRPRVLVNSTPPQRQDAPARRSRCAWRADNRLVHGPVQQAGLRQDVQSGVGGGAAHQGPGSLLAGPAQGRVGAQDLHAAVRPAGVGVHHAPRHLHQLAQMAHQDQLPDPRLRGAVRASPIKLEHFTILISEGIRTLSAKKSAP